jgi:glycosyltransferase involved in cell wall biosynthesis
MKYLKKIVYQSLILIFSLFFIPVAVACSLIIRFKFTIPAKPRLVWGSTPIINNSYWSRALVNAGFSSETFCANFFSIINRREDWDKILAEEYRWISRHARPFVAFIHGLFLYDIFFISFNGFFLGNTPVKIFQAHLLKIARKKIVILPYGSDSYVYRNIRSISTVHGLLMSYPLASREQHRISQDVDYWIKHADVVLPGFMGPDGFGRWDALIPSPLFIDLQLWKSSRKLNEANGIVDEVVIAHAPNHRGFKGSEFVISAVEELRKEGLKIRLILLERVQNDQVRKVLEFEADILIEQLVFTGHGMNGLEGLASGLPVISNLEDETYVLPMRRWSYFSECPMVSGTPENLVDVLRQLVTRPELRHKLGRAGRAYVEKYQGLDSAQYLFSNVIDYVYGRKESLINLYHPLLGEYPNRSSKIQHPLVNNRIID